MDKIRVACIGVGGMGRHHVKACHELPEFELVALCDSNRKSLSTAKKTTGCRKAYTDYRQMLEKENLDAVVVVLPHDLYPQVISDLADCGVHILKEKPLARTYDEGLKMVLKAEKAKVKFMIGTQRRYHPCFQSMKNMVSELGEIFLIRGQYLFSFPGQFGWRGQLDRCGAGALLDMGYHTVDMMLWYVGMPDVVQMGMASLHQRFTGCAHDTDDCSVTFVKYKNGPIGYLVTTWYATPKEERMLIHGQKGSLEASPSMFCLRKPTGEELKRVEMSGTWDEAIKNQERHFACCILDHAEPLTPARSNLANMAFMEAAYTSAKKGIPVNPKEMLRDRPRGGRARTTMY